MIPLSETQDLEIKDYTKLIKDHIWLVIMTVLVMLAFVIIYHAFCTKVYKATATITIERQLPKVTERRRQDVYGEEMRDREYYESQYDSLTSLVLAQKVVKILDKKIYPEFASTSAAEKLISMIEVQPVKDTLGLVKISVKSKDPSKAADLANVIAQEFINQSIGKNKQMTELSISWLSKQIAELKERLQIEQEELGVFMGKNKITSSDKDAEGVLRDLKNQKAELQKDINAASKVYGDDHPNLVLIKEQIGMVENRIREEEASLLLMQGKMAEYNLLKKRLDVDQGLYNDFIDKVRELEVFKGSGLANVKITDAAKAPKVPIIPRPIKKDLVVNVMMGLFFGIGLCFFFEFMGTTFMVAEEVIRFVKIPFLGVVPTISNNIIGDEEKSLLAHSSSNDKVVEAYDDIATAILFAAPKDEPPKSILISSAVSGEGENFVASNLAITFANLNERIVLVDMNLRRPNMHTTYKIDRAPGLTDYLTGSAGLDQVMKPTFVQNLSLIPAGTVLKNPTGVLALEKARSLILELQQKFDRVVLNSAPILNFIDTSFLSHLVEGVVLVIRAESTRFEDVMKAKEKILSTKGNLIGAVLNNIPPDKKDIFYYYHHFTPPQIKRNKVADKK